MSNYAAPRYIQTNYDTLKAGDGVTISWADVDYEVNRYVLHRSTDDAPSSARYAGTDTYFRETVPYCTTVNYYVQAVTVNEEFGEIATCSCPVWTDPTTPTSFSVSNMTPKVGDTVKLSWEWSPSDKYDEILGYFSVGRDASSGGRYDLGTTREYSMDVTIPAEVTTTFRVAAFDSLGAVSANISVTTQNIQNTAPTSPKNVTVSERYPKVGERFTLSWSASTDVDLNLSGYIVERNEAFEVEGTPDLQWNEWHEVYRGGNCFFEDVALSCYEMMYWVRAYDSEGAESDANMANVRPICNTPPKIDGSDGNLGSFTDSFTKNYVVTDDEGGTVSVVEAVDGVAFSTSSNVTLGASNTVRFPTNIWLSLGLGLHTLTITATDNQGESASRTYTFTKLATEIELTYDPCYSVDVMPTVGILTIKKVIPEGATFSVEVCNNALDTVATWEVVTATVNQGGRFYFENSKKTASKWAFNARIKVERNNTVGDCYISSVSGYFR